MPSLLDIYASYVPRLVFRRALGRKGPLAGAELERFETAVLIADVSGFTRLTEHFAQQGPAGAEALTAILNGYFAKLIDLILGHGGDVVKFAGDAVLALWPQSDRPLPASASLAAQCAAAIQARLHDYEAAPGLRLSLRVGAAAGEVLAAQLGGVEGRYELMLTGPALRAAFAAADGSRPGDVVLSPEIQSLLRARPQKEPPRPATVPLPTRESEGALRAFLPEAVLSRLTAGQTEWIGEHRLITVLFVNLPGLDGLVAADLAAAQAAVRAAQEAVYRYDGSINKLSVDDKGASLVAAFGLPPRSHEDDASRGVLCAKHLAARLQALGCETAIGVTTGMGFCGVVGDPRRREYTVMGDVVNLAARLMTTARAAAKSEGAAGEAAILCDEATTQAARERLSFFRLPPVTLKGKARPVAVSRPLEVLTGRARGEGPPLLGRQAEVAVLHEVLDALFDGRGATLLLTGEAGVGKSRLCEELRRLAEARGAAVLPGAADAIDRHAPYHALRGVFAELLGPRPGEAEEPREARALRLLRELAVPEADPSGDGGNLAAGASGATADDDRGDGAARASRAPAAPAGDARGDGAALGSLLCAVVPLDLPESDLVRQMPPEVRADNTRELLLRLLRGAARRGPLVVTLEDAHWMDSASRALLLALAAEAPPLLLCVSTRPRQGDAEAEGEEAGEDFRAALRALDSVRVLPVGPLRSEDALELARRHLGASALPAELQVLILERAEGNALLTEELARALRDLGLVRVEGGECVVGDLDPRRLDVLRTAQGAVQSRIDQLGPAQQLALKVGSVLGRSFPLPALLDIYPVASDRAALPQTLRSLERLELLACEQAGAGSAWAFRHVLLREVAYNLMLFSQRRELHRAAAAWYERQGASDLRPFHALLGRHFRLGELPGRAIHYLALAGEEAQRLGASREAAELLGEALALGEAHPAEMAPLDRARCLRQLGEARFSLSEPRAAREALERALGLLGAAPPPPRRLRGAVLRAALRQLLGLGLAALPLPRPRPRRDEATLEAARAYERLAEIHYLESDKLQTLHAAMAGLQLAESYGPSPELARACASMAVGLGSAGAHGLAGAYVRRALSLSEKAGQLSARVWVALATSIYRGGVAQWDEARAALHEALAISERLGDERRLRECQVTLALVEQRSGQLAAADALFSALLAAGRRRKSAQVQAWGLIGLLQGQRLRGEPMAAAAELAALVSREQAALAGTDLLEACGALALCRLAEGRLEEADALCEEAARLIAGASTFTYTLTAYSAVAEVRLARWARARAEGPALPGGDAPKSEGHEEPEAREAALAAQRALARFARIFPIGLPAALRAEGRIAQLLGRAAAARRAFVRGAAAARRLRMPLEEAQLQRDLAPPLELPAAAPR